MNLRVTVVGKVKDKDVRSPVSYTHLFNHHRLALHVDESEEDESFICEVFLFKSFQGGQRCV